ncbi:DUF4303 domain-containing protein [Maribacter luteus]|uniref:DUF4303 domain-containing protein n=1 Tax=Maribacter luteus TaxID=2594478 RepID=A0A6I2MM71_9FLAO|nr:DUF4303 domain-containing protein [Maribacter luteus]MRX64092.1 DUF4303 domain-containing protein [Maribacter luteus]
MNTDFNFEELKSKIEFAVKKSFKENIQKYGSDICSFSLISDDGAMTLVPYTNTKSHLEKMQSQDPKYKDFYEFEPVEWFTSNGAKAEFHDLCQTLSVETDKEELDFENFRNIVFETCVQVLEKLRTEGFFQKELGKNLLVQFNISDTNEPKENLIKWTKRLNDKKNGKRYQDYMNHVFE